jgi:hypothetical protein
LKNGHHYVVVCVQVRNASRWPNCTSLSGRLKVDTGYEYPAEQLKTLESPTEQKIFPTEESEGGYIFEVNDGTSPVALTLVREEIGETMCEQAEGRDIRFSRLKSVTLSLK